MSMKAKLNVVAIVFLLFVACLAAGCATAKGVGAVGTGVAKDTHTACKGVAAGGYGVWQGILAADQWFKENLW